MCNACGFQCCAYDGFEKCGCDHCSNPACWDDDDTLYDDEPDDCDHDDYEADILTGRATCGRCGHSWYQTKEDVERESQHQREYDALCAQWDAEEAARTHPQEGSGG